MYAYEKHKLLTFIVITKFIFRCESNIRRNNICYDELFYDLWQTRKSFSNLYFIVFQVSKHLQTFVKGI
jgi:hypothetical protein